jgi:hypothetical protein
VNGYLPKFSFAVEHETAHSARICIPDVGRFLNRVAVRQSVRRNAKGKTQSNSYRLPTSKFDSIAAGKATISFAGFALTENVGRGKMKFEFAIFFLDHIRINGEEWSFRTAEEKPF